MPKLNSYKNKEGLYIRAAQGGQISTYQVTKRGEEELRREGYGRGGEISPADLKVLRDRGLIYTRGNGPGALESLPPAQAPPRVLDPATSPSRQADQTFWLDPREHPGPYLETLPPRSREDRNPTILVLTVGGIALLAIVALLLIHLLLWVLLLFLPFGLMAGFLAKMKGRPISEGYFWGQFIGPVGLIFVTFLPAGDPMQAHPLREAQSARSTRGARASSDTGAVIIWSLVGLVLIVLLFVLVIVMSGDGS